MLLDPRKILLKVWLRAKYKPVIRHFNESDRMGAIFHLFEECNEIYLSLSYNKKIQWLFGISEQTFNNISKDVYEEIVKCYDPNEDLDISLHIR